MKMTDSLPPNMLWLDFVHSMRYEFMIHVTRAESTIVFRSYRLSLYTYTTIFYFKTACVGTHWTWDILNTRLIANHQATKMVTDFYVYIFYQYNGKRPPEDGSTAKKWHPEIMKYSAESGQCWLRPGVGLDIHATKMKKYQTLLGFGLQVTWPSPVAVPIKLPWPFLLRTVLILYVIAVDGYVNHSSDPFFIPA